MTLLKSPKPVNHVSDTEEEVISDGFEIIDENTIVSKKLNKKKKRKKKNGKSRSEALAVALLSVKDDKTIVSQTLAIILENQGSNSEAIEMYKRLILKFPEKSSYFAKKIKKLNKKI